MFISFCM